MEGTGGWGEVGELAWQGILMEKGILKSPTCESTASAVDGPGTVCSWNRVLTLYTTLTYPISEIRLLPLPDFQLLRHWHTFHSYYNRDENHLSVCSPVLFDPANLHYHPTLVPPDITLLKWPMNYLFHFPSLEPFYVTLVQGWLVSCTFNSPQNAIVDKQCLLMFLSLVFHDALIVVLVPRRHPFQTHNGYRFRFHFGYTFLAS